VSEPSPSVTTPYGQPRPDAETLPAEPFGRADIAVALGTGAAVALLGVPVGLLWAVLSPRVPLVRTAAGTSLAVPETKAFITADGIFLLLGAGVGVLCGLAVWGLGRRRGEAAVVGLALGGLLAAVIGWKTGHQLYLGDYRHAVRTAGFGARFQAAVDLRAKGALVAWPVAALMTYLGLVVFAERRPQRPVADFQPPHPRQVLDDKPRS